MTHHELLISLLRAGLCEGYTPTLPDNVDWEAIRQLAQRQSVEAMVWDGIAKLAEGKHIDTNNMPDKATKLRWALSVDQAEKRYNKQHGVIAYLATLFADNDIKMMILKGYGLSLCYPTPNHRSCSDIDIWLYGKQQLADDILRQKLGIKIDEGRHHHTVFRIDGVLVENHFDFLDIHGHHSNRDIENELIKRTEEASVAISIDNSIVYAPPINLHALFLVRHAAAHFAAVGIVLRHITDWAMFLRHYAKEIDWTWLYDVCRKHNMDKFLDAINGFAVDYFDIDSSLLPLFTRRPKLEARIINDILSPAYGYQTPDGGIVKISIFKVRRWWANRWKHRLVYSEGLLRSFATQSWAHILKPNTIKR